MRSSRRLRIVTLGLAIGALATGGSATLPRQTQPAATEHAAKTLPGYGGPVSEQASGTLSPAPLLENYELEAAGGRPRSAPAPKRIRGSFMVSLAPGQNPREAAPAIAEEYGGEAALIYESADSGFLFRGPDDVRERLPSDPRVRSVQPDYVAYTAETSASVHLNAINQPAAKNAGHRGQGVRVAILDTGADFDHSDYKSNIDLGLSRGFSYNSTTKVCSTSGDWTGGRDRNGHGTRTISQAVGAIGVAPDARGVVLKVFPESSSSTSFGLIKCGVDYLVGLNSDGNETNDVQIANASIAGSGSAGSCTDGGLRQAVCALVNGVAGTTTRTAFFVAAGNSGANAGNYAPGRYPESITISGFDCDSINCTTTKPKLASWSNRGSTIDGAAPGVAIYSAKLGGGHSTASGTSRAAPQQAGAGAVLLSAFPGLSPTEIRTALQKGGKCPNANPGGTAPNCTSGSWTSDSDGVAEPFLNVGGAVNAATPATPTPPSAPVNVSAVPGNAQATVSWSPPSSNGGSAITSYTVTQNPGGTSTQVDDSQTSVTITGLTNGTAYTFSVAATNSIGTGPSATSNAVTPSEPTAPTAPRNVSAVAGDAQATVSWSPPSSNGGSAITSYTVTKDPGGTATEVNGNQTSVTITGLTNGTSYTFSVAATNSIGTGPSATSNSVTPTADPPTWTRIEQNGSGVAYTTGWSSNTANSCTSGGSYRYSGSTGATVDFTFTGTGVRWVTALAANLGKAEIWVDNETTHTFVDTYRSSQLCNQIKFERTGLSPGSHTLHVRVHGTKNASSSNDYVIVDAFERLS